MRARDGGPQKARVRDFDARARSLIVNSYLDFENVRAAALAGNFQLIQIGYYRNEARRTAMAESNPDRRKFIEWAVDQIKRRLPKRMTQAELLRVWASLEDAQQKEISTVNPTGWFKTVCGVKLEMEELRNRARMEVCGGPAANVGLQTKADAELELSESGQDRVNGNDQGHGESRDDNDFCVAENGNDQGQGEPNGDDFFVADTERRTQREGERAEEREKERERGKGGGRAAT
jgi:hypothetical protein